MKTTKEHFDLFKKYGKKYADFWGLSDWELIFSNEDIAKDTYASTNADQPSKSVLINLTKTWHDDITEDKIELAAFHEVCEILLSKLRSLATSRYVMSENDIDEATHGIIARLQNSVWKNRHLFQLSPTWEFKRYEPVFDGEKLVVPPISP